MNTDYTYLVTLFTRELNKVKNELSLYPDEKMVWETVPGISNSAGNLTLHIIGNLKHFIGATLGHSNYVRQREMEFSTIFTERTELLKGIDETIAVISSTIPLINEETWQSIFPLKINEEAYPTILFIHHLLIHLGYHQGQINYLRRTLSNKDKI